MRRIRTECPRCGAKVTAPDLETELRETKGKLHNLQRSVANHFARIAEAGRVSVKKARKGGSGE